MHLVGIPVGGEVRQVDYADVGTEVLDLLGVPQGEGIVVAVGKYYGVVAERSWSSQVCETICRGTMRPITQAIAAEATSTPLEL